MDTAEEKASLRIILKSFTLFRGHHAFSTVGIRVDGVWEDDDSDWMGDVAEDTNDELLACQATGDCERCSAYFFPDQATEFCRMAEYVYDNIGRFTAMAEEKVRRAAEKYGLC